jgi:trehalose synthase
MIGIQDIPVAPVTLERLRPVLGMDAWLRLAAAAHEAQTLLAGRTVWVVNSTAAGGGVAEMLRALVPYVKGAGVNARWAVVAGDDDFFRVTKRLHNLLHGHAGDGLGLGARERTTYERMLAADAAALAAAVRPGDVVVLHDPQTAALVEPLQRRGAIVVWRCHVGTDDRNEHVDSAWEFLTPYVAGADALVFSRLEHVPAALWSDRVSLITPSIDPLSPKNVALSPAVARALVDWAQIPIEHPIVLQVSRWDRLKDPVGVLHGFTAHVLGRANAQLVLAGPSAESVADDPEGAQTLATVRAAWAELAPRERARVTIACLPMDDLTENALLVNALQRRASVVVQKSLQEGFGLTVTEAMWKSRPVVASAVGGIRDQIEHRRTGLLLSDPADLREFGDAVVELLGDRVFARQIASAGHGTVRERFLPDHHLERYVELLERVLAPVASAQRMSA